MNHNKSAKDFELNNLARNIPPVLRDCGLNGLPWQTRIGRIRDWDKADCNFEHHSLYHVSPRARDLDVFFPRKRAGNWVTRIIACGN